MNGPITSIGEWTFYSGFLVALILEHLGFILLSKGMRQSRKDSGEAPGERFRGTALNPWVWSGVVLQAIYYIMLLGFLQRLPVSLVIPMTGFGYVLTAFMARIFLKEHVSFRRWVGILLITSGVFLVSRS
ncbi:MAG: EamA family transporter [Leptospirillum sp.]|nr:EamA family transporter [Nitrospiraceae bacterium]